MTPPEPREIEPRAPDDLGLVQVYWGDGKGKTTAALGTGFRAAGHGFRVHLLQFMKGGAGSVEDLRGEYAAIERMPGFSYEAAGEYGWHGFDDGSSDAAHEERAEAGLERAREIATTKPADVVPFDTPAEDGVHVLVLDEILYAANRGLVEPGDVVSLVEDRAPDVELVLTGGHRRPDYVCGVADLVTHVEKGRHPIDDGVGARRGTEY